MHLSCRCDSWYHTSCVGIGASCNVRMLCFVADGFVLVMLPEESEQLVVDEVVFICPRCQLMGYVVLI